ncbi:MAG: GIY-YIG nuclease family protein [Saprospiraceae bacterium]
MFTTYILWSERMHKYYIGSTGDLADRLERHNLGREHYTSKGVPWIVVHSEEFVTRAEAVNKEFQIKKRGAKRYIESLN